MIQREFTAHVVEIIKTNPEALGLAVGGSWITNELDEYSDLDLILVTKSKLSDDFSKMKEIASGFGNLLNAFTGEHVGEPRIIICLYDDPFLHVDIKFLTIEEFKERVEDPVIVWEKENRLTEIIEATESTWPALDFQWIEDRFWTWVHYAILKIGRGEYFEALDFLSYMRVNVIAPLLQVKNGQLPRGVRKVEFNLQTADLEKLKTTVASYEIKSIINSLEQNIKLYLQLRDHLYPFSLNLNEKLAQKTQQFLEEIKRKKLIDLDAFS